MTQKAIAYVLLLLVCGSAAAEPIHKQTRTVAAPRAAKAKNVETTPKEPAKEPSAKEPPANELFGAATALASLGTRAIGSYAKGCLAGAVALPMNGPDWQVMRLSRNRNWGHPRLLDFLERFAADARTLDGWPGLLVGDISQPRGGPMITGHASHQIGLDVDIWLTPMPASYPEVDRIFVHPAIKKVLCGQAGDDRAWLGKVRPWWNHYYHFHVRVTCPPNAGDCEPQKPLSGDDGCGQELSNWFAMLKKAAITGAGWVSYAGNPKSVEKKITGAGKISPRD